MDALSLSCDGEVSGLYSYLTTGSPLDHRHIYMICEATKLIEK